jgi:hypothetical protein
MSAYDRVTALALGLCCSCGVAIAAESRVRFGNGNPAAPHLDVLGEQVGQQLRPIRIVGARNGRFSGKVVVSSSGTLKDVSATVTDLQTADLRSRLPAAQIQVRFATGGLKSGWLVQPKAGSTFDVLLEDQPLGEVAPIASADKYHTWVQTGRSYLPIWVTVTVPARAAPGEYSGRLHVRVAGESKDIPISLAVHGYTLPDARDFQTWIETIQSPDTLALEYEEPLWSDKHWQLIEQSLRYGAMLGNKTVYFPLICESNLGNAESAVRWVRRGANHYEYDLSLVERYLDIQIRLQGKPRIVCFPLWDTFLEGGQFAGDIKYESAEARQDRLAYQGKGPAVTLLEPGSGRTEKLELPQFSDPASAGLWLPLLKQLPELLKNRGLEDALFFGMANDAVPHPACLNLVRQCIPGAKWVIHAHSFYGGKDKKANFQYAAFVWGVKGFCCGEKGWRNPFLLTQFLRNMSDHYPITTYRLAPEVNLTGGQRGIGRIGLDYWRVFRSKRGVRMASVSDRYPKASWRNLNITDSLLAPGTTGPLATARFEMLREGVQECEARIFIQDALDRGDIPDALADRCRSALAQRDEFLKKVAIVPGTGRLWFADANPSEAAYLEYATGWQAQSQRLYQAAAELVGKGGTP